MAILKANWPRWPRPAAKVFNGETAFKLHDTPTASPRPHRRHLPRTPDHRSTAAAFDAAMAASANRRAPPAKFKMAAQLEYEGPNTTFHGYDMLEAKGNVLALYGQRCRQ